MFGISIPRTNACLIDREVRGKMRKLLVHVNKGGFTFVLDRTNGEFLGAYPIIDNYNWITGVTETGKLVGRKEPAENKSTYICPSAAGGKSWNQIAFSPRTGFIYTPSLEVCNDLFAAREDAEGRREFLGRQFSDEASAEGSAAQSRGRLRCRDGQAPVDVSVSIFVARIDPCDGGRSGVHGRSRGQLLRAGCSQRREVVEL